MGEVLWRYPCKEVKKALQNHSLMGKQARSWSLHRRLVAGSLLWLRQSPARGMHGSRHGAVSVTAPAAGAGVPLV